MRWKAWLIGLTLLCMASAAEAASFDCGKAESADEKAVCSACTLGELDVKLATLYGVATRMVAMGTRGVLQDQQSDWLEARKACGADLACLTQAYEKRIAEIEAMLERIYQGGPY